MTSEHTSLHVIQLEKTCPVRMLHSVDVWEVCIVPVPVLSSIQPVLCTVVWIRTLAEPPVKRREKKKKRSVF